MKFILFVLLLSCCMLTAAQDKDSLSGYTGKYSMNLDGVTFPAEVVLENGVLSIKGPDGSLALERAAKDSFKIVGLGGTAVFLRNGNGRVDRLRMQAEGKTAEGIKDPAQSAIIRSTTIGRKEEIFALRN